jgi:hypothetical protein
MDEIDLCDVKLNALNEKLIIFKTLACDFQEVKLKN